MVVVPALNCEPDLGLQLMMTGAVPPLIAGSANCTAVLSPLFLSFTGAIVGHVSPSGGGG
jgi:hypothetical protein